jgi:hypothetical protein
MPFGAFVDLVAAGDERHYMTTQDLDVDEDGRPALLSPPCSDLLAAGDFPLRPRVMGNLILMNANMWYGNSAAGSSSGLHHDFHDNLYVLLRGKKRFRLFSPLDAHRMYTTGRMAMVHPNGRICYDGLLTGADGADVASIKAMEAEKEQAVAAEDADRAQRALAAGEGGAEEWVRRAEARMEAAMDAVLEAEMAGAGAGDGDFGSEEEEEEEEEGGGGGEGEGEEGEEGEGGERVDEGEEEKDDSPVNFSGVDESLSTSELTAKYPLFATGTTETSVMLGAGDMLYLPAGWFHEVFSLSDSISSIASPGGESGTSGKSGGSCGSGVGGSGDAKEGGTQQDHVEGCAGAGHMAFNYWFHPPDATDGGADGGGAESGTEDRGGDGGGSSSSSSSSSTSTSTTSSTSTSTSTSSSGSGVGGGGGGCGGVGGGHGSTAFDEPYTSKFWAWDWQQRQDVDD